MAQDVIEVTTAAAIASTASKSTYFGGLTAVYGWVASSEGAAVFGVLVALAGLVVNLFFRWRDSVAQRKVEAQREAREQELHALRMQRLKVGAPVVDMDAVEVDE